MQRSSQHTGLLYGRTGSLRLEASFARALRQLGWQVEIFHADPGGRDLSWWLRSRVGRRLTRRSLWLRRLGARQRNEVFRRTARELDPDLVLVVNGAFLMPETLLKLRSEGIPVSIFHPDAPLPGYQAHRPEHLATAREADVSFIWSQHLRARLQEEGARRSVYLPFAWDPDVFPYVQHDGKTEPKVIFVGGWDRCRERWLEPVARHFQLEIWGSDYWNTRTRSGSPLRGCWRGRAIRGREAGEAMARAAISLNILRKQNLPDGTNMRTFEIPGAGGFQLSTRTSGASDIYLEGEAGAYFGSIEELLEKIAYFLEHEDERKCMMRRAHAITEVGHRYIHRMDQMLYALGLES